ncbi:unnamed protein product [Toxocara canis]|uniref:L-Fucosyltransferase n=1 Tax=Toxocara canis TaxID=6265 RepID=A0A183USD4_TOXCA|nr:unnamed protein product [Toxocara canis]
MRTFQRLGGNVKFDQPWILPNIVIIEELTELENSPQRYVVSNFSYSPGLGNLMFQYASLRAIAAKYEAKVIMPSDCTLRRGFELDAVYVSRRLNDLLIQKLDVEKRDFKECCRYYANSVDGLFSRPEQKFELLIGYFQAFPYFHPEHEFLIRQQFRFLPSVVDLAKGFIHEAKLEKMRAEAKPVDGNDPNGNDQAAILDVDDSLFTYIGVHIRHGIDITLNSRNRKHGHTVATKAYFENAMNYYRDRYGNVIFVVASDSLSWANANIGSRRRGEVFFLNSTDREVDLAALVYCNHTIMSTGTFSWWAAYLADGDAVYYGDWPKPGSVLQKIVQKEDFFLEKWTAMR